MPRKGLGEILREADLISEAQLGEALALQKTYGERLASARAWIKEAGIAFRVPRG